MAKDLYYCLILCWWYRLVIPMPMTPMLLHATTITKQSYAAIGRAGGLASGVCGVDKRVGGPHVAKTANKLSEFLINPLTCYMEAADRDIAYIENACLWIDKSPNPPKSREIRQDDWLPWKIEAMKSLPTMETGKDVISKGPFPNVGIKPLATLRLFAA